MYYQTNCKECPKKVHCCINGFVFVTSKDALRIKKRTHLSFEEFLDKTSLSKKIVAILKHDDPSLEGALRYSQLQDKNRLLRLQKVKGNCIFLDETGRCKIYSVRPNICRIYPFWVMRLINGKLKIIEHDIDTKCSVIKGKDVKDILSKKEENKIKKLFRKIEKEKSNLV
jgi:Fe-S-cluster containining protein